jgi:hypothetical protein
MGSSQDFQNNRRGVGIVAAVVIPILIKSIHSRVAHYRPYERNQLMLLRCKKDGVALALVTQAEGDVFAVCPDCGSGWKYEEVAENSAGLVSGILSEEQLVSLRKQIRISGERFH